MTAFRQKASEDCGLLNQIFEQDSIQTVFHPICSVLKHELVAVEALASVMDPRNQKPLHSGVLFAAAERFDRLVALDRLCRQKALEAFRAVHDMAPDVTLFVNFEASILDKGTLGSGTLANYVEAHHLDPGLIVIEIVESKVHNLANLSHFVDTYRKAGFQIALDDIGVGHSNLDRIALLKPDVLKTDRSLVTNIHEEYYKQEIFASIVKLAHKLGALVVAEGVETEEEALEVLDLGADLIQGYYFCQPGAFGEAMLGGVNHKASHLAEQFKVRLLDNRQTEHRESEVYTRIAYSVAHEIERDLEQDTVAEINQTLQRLVESSPEVECLYVLDPEGIQVSDIVFSPSKPRRRNHLVLQLSQPGTDHSLKEYFIGLRSGGHAYLTPPYISLASGGVCRTFSLHLCHAPYAGHVLCVDFVANHS